MLQGNELFEVEVSHGLYFAFPLLCTSADIERIVVADASRGFSCHCDYE